MDMGVRGESDLRGAYCVSVDCRVGHFRSLLAMKRV
jgi:hypothetical protein